jgi:hypothetical protein
MDVDSSYQETARMHPRIAELLAYLDHNRDVLRASVNDVPPERWEVRPGPERWTVLDVLEHLSLVEPRVMHVIAMRAAEARAQGLGPDQETAPVIPTLDMTRVLDRGRPLVAGEAVRPRAELGAAGVWSALEDTRRRSREIILAADGLALGQIVHPHPVLGPIDLYQWIAFVGAHEARHTAQIREIGTLLSERSSVTSPGGQGS